MSDILNELIRLGVTVGLFLVSTVITLIAKKITNKKFQDKVIHIAETVEQLYKDCGSTIKLKAFKDLCSDQKLNINKAVDFLERCLIKPSKTLNMCNIEKSDNDDNMGDIA